MFFVIIITFVIGQRIVELIVAKRNERWARQNGAIEYGANHYKYIVSLHMLFFLSMTIEYTLYPILIEGWYFFFSSFMLAQGLRIWSLVSLGKHWNTKILIIPQSVQVTKGPYRFMKHPNYVVVAIELFTLPMIFGAFVTAILFSLLNFIVIYFIRIPKEEVALQSMQVSTKQK